MQPESNPLPLNLTADARAWLLAQRPGLPSFDIAVLLRPAPGDPQPEITDAPSEPESSAPPGLGDRVAAILQRLGIPAAIALLQRRRWLPANCGCPSRQARLNALTPRLLSLLHPWSLTAATALAWMAFLLLLSRL